MALLDDLKTNVDDILRQSWTVRAGQVVPEIERIAMDGGAVKLEATMLYADLADSTDLAMRYDHRIAAKVFKSFLKCCTKLIIADSGQIRSFDGDRVMGVFVGDYKNTFATICGLKINWVFQEIIKPKLKAQYEVLRNGSYELAHCVGIDTSEVFVVRSGIRNNNDLVWIGRAPNIAAKLSSIRNSPYHTYISDTVYNKLNEEAKTSNGQSMWEKRNWNGGIDTIYRSEWRRRL